jgi:hypothetical protein
VFRICTFSCCSPTISESSLSGLVLLAVSKHARDKSRSILIANLVLFVQGNDGTVQFSPIAGPTFVSEVRPGYGIQANNFPGFSFPSQQEGSTGINAGLYKPSHAVGTEANTGVTYTTSTLYIEDGEQCGGKGGECEVQTLLTSLGYVRFPSAQK